MPFYRFEDLGSHYLTPHLWTGKAPVIEGRDRRIVAPGEAEQARVNLKAN